MNDSANAYICLGSNIGDRKNYLLNAVESLHALPGITVVRCSSIYETEPVDYTEQPLFLNMVIAVSSSLSPIDLLDSMLEIERESGRVRDIRYGPRTIDLDLLLYGEEKLDTDRLTLPHPRMMERAFVLVPLLEIMPEEQRRSFGSFDQAAANGKGDVQLWQKTNWHSASGRFAN